MKNKQAAKRYKELADELANYVTKIGDIYESLEYLGNRCGDNMDPVFCVEKALVHLAKGLAHTLNYANDYAKEDPEKLTTEDNEE